MGVISVHMRSWLVTLEQQPLCYRKCIYRKSRKIKALTTNFRLHIKVTVPLLNSSSLAYHDMRKAWYPVAGVYGSMIRSC